MLVLLYNRYFSIKRGEFFLRELLPYQSPRNLVPRARVSLGTNTHNPFHRCNVWCRFSLLHSLRFNFSTIWSLQETLDQKKMTSQYRVCDYQSVDRIVIPRKWNVLSIFHLDFLKVADSKREEFRKYLEKAGVMDALTKGKLYKNFIRN